MIPLLVFASAMCITAALCVICVGGIVGVSWWHERKVDRKILVAEAEASAYERVRSDYDTRKAWYDRQPQVIEGGKKSSK